MVGSELGPGFRWIAPAPRSTGPSEDPVQRFLAVVLIATLFLLATAPSARAEYVLFDETSDTIDVSGQTVIGSACTYEAVVMFPAAKHVKRSGLHVAHQFGVEMLDSVKEEELCVPSALAAE